MPARYICDVLDEMRNCHKTRNYSVLPGLIEEAQILANRMEAALTNKRNYHTWHDKLKKEKKEFDKLRKKTDELRKKKGEEPKGKDNFY